MTTQSNPAPTLMGAGQVPSASLGRAQPLGSLAPPSPGSPAATLDAT